MKTWASYWSLKLRFHISKMEIRTLFSMLFNMGPRSSYFQTECLDLFKINAFNHFLIHMSLEWTLCVTCENIFSVLQHYFFCLCNELWLQNAKKNWLESGKILSQQIFVLSLYPQIGKTVFGVWYLSMLFILFKTDHLAYTYTLILQDSQVGSLGNKTANSLFRFWILTTLRY